MDWAGSYLQSVFEKFLALIIVLTLLPLMLFVSIIIFLDDGFPIFYYQKSLGKNHKPFNLYKFRSMKNDTPLLSTEKMHNAENYLLKSGKFLRKYSIDELPQFLNVIFGDIKIVGPRPCMSKNESKLKSLREKYNIHKIYPGITGWAQVNGRDENTIEQKIILDKYYYDNRSFIFDIKIFFITVKVVLLRRGIRH